MELTGPNPNFDYSNLQPGTQVEDGIIRCRIDADKSQYDEGLYYFVPGYYTPELEFITKGNPQFSPDVPDKWWVTGAFGPESLKQESLKLVKDFREWAITKVDGHIAVSHVYWNEELIRLVS